MHLSPIADDEHILGGQQVSQCAHIKLLYAIEEHKDLKISQSLKQTSYQVMRHVHFNMH